MICTTPRVINVCLDYMQIKVILLSLATLLVCQQTLTVLINRSEVGSSARTDQYVLITTHVDGIGLKVSLFLILNCEIISNL